MKVNKPNLDLISPFDCSNDDAITNTSENMALSYNQNTIQNCSEICDDKSQIKNIIQNKDLSQNEDNSNTCNLNDQKIEEDTISLLETVHPETSQLSKSPNQENKKKIKSKLGFAQMRIDSSVYFDNMGYSYQIQNEKNDKK